LAGQQTGDGTMIPEKTVIQGPDFPPDALPFQRRNLRYAVACLAILVVLGLSLVPLRGNPAELRVTALGIGLVALTGMAWLHRRWIAGWLLATGVTLIAFAALDETVAFVTGIEPHSAAVWLEGSGLSPVVHDADLGYAPRPNSILGSEKRDGSTLIYRARYSIDALGHRLTKSTTDPGAATVVFVGCSVTFGDGLEDSGTLPQQFSAVRGYRERVVNAGYSGYGTHQVLRLLQTGRPKPWLGSGKRYFVYSAIPDHLRRFSGFSWDFWGPRYELRDGRPAYVGPLYSALGGWLRKLARKSAMFAVLESAYWRSTSASAIPLFVAMLEEARRLARERYDANFIVLLWDLPTTINRGMVDTVEEMVRQMNSAGIDYIPVSRILGQNRPDFEIPGDGHPSRLANAKIAAYLAGALR
jgi:hypothetical protein